MILINRENMILFNRETRADGRGPFYRATRAVKKYVNHADGVIIFIWVLGQVHRTIKVVNNHVVSR
jgi:hypothetical protein